MEDKEASVTKTDDNGSAPSFTHNQEQGTVDSVRRRRPVLIWVIFFWLLASGSFLLWSLYDELTQLNLASLVNRGMLNVNRLLVFGGALVLDLFGAISLVMLKKAAVGYFGFSLILQLSYVAYEHTRNLLAEGKIVGVGGVNVIFGIVALSFGLFYWWYARRLRARGLLT